jgi:GntR family transcriptional regulator
VPLLKIAADVPIEKMPLAGELAPEVVIVLFEITLPLPLCKGLTKATLDAHRGSMYSLFETQFGVHPLRARERLKAIAADRAGAVLLKVEPGTPLLAVERVTLTYGERPVEYRRGLCNTRRHFYANELG